MFAKWIKKQYKYLPSLFTFPNYSDLLSYFISIRILRREGSTVSINGENAQLAQSHVIHSRMNSSQASRLFAQCSFHQLALLPLPWGLTGLPTEAPPCDVHIVLGKLRPCVARWPKAAATPQQVATVSSFHPDSQFLSKEQCTRVAWNSRDFFLKASPKVFFFLIEAQLIYNVVRISAVRKVIQLYTFFLIFFSITHRMLNTVPCAMQ